MAVPLLEGGGKGKRALERGKALFVLNSVTYFLLTFSTDINMIFRKIIEFEIVPEN